MQTTLGVRGMTCDHCVAAVTQELVAMDGVQAVDAEVIPDGTSRVTITSDRELAPEAVRAAIDEAGYELADG